MPQQDPTLLDENLRVFLLENIDSFEGIEALLLLRRHPGQAWSVDAVAEALSVRDLDAKDALVELCDRGLVERDATEAGVRFTYPPSNNRFAEQIERLARAYETARFDVLRVLSANAVERGERALARLFAGVFVLGRKKDG